MNKIAKYSRSQDYYKAGNGPVVILAVGKSVGVVKNKPKDKPKRAKDRYHGFIMKFHRRVEDDPRNRKRALILAGKGWARKSEDIDLNKMRAEFEKKKYKLMVLKDHDCFICESIPVHRHHVVPLGKGGRNESRNLVALCEDCHAEMHPWMLAAKRNRELDERLQHLIGVR